MRIAMIGSGYVGLVSGACLADFGHNVICVDKDPNRIAMLERGEIPIFEPGLEDLVATNVKQKRLSFTLDLAQAVSGADAVFIAVGTPSRRRPDGISEKLVFRNDRAGAVTSRNGRSAVASSRFPRSMAAAPATGATTQGRPRASRATRAMRTAA